MVFASVSSEAIESSDGLSETVLTWAFGTYNTSIDFMYSPPLADVAFVFVISIVPEADPLNTYSASEVVRVFEVPNALPPTVADKVGVLFPDACTLMYFTVPSTPPAADVKVMYLTGTLPVP